MRNTRVIVGRTNKALANQGYTYNEAGLTYNEIGVQYGGVYGSDIISLANRAKATKPNIQVSANIKPTIRSSII